MVLPQHADWTRHRGGRYDAPDGGEGTAARSDRATEDRGRSRNLVGEVAGRAGPAEGRTVSTAGGSVRVGGSGRPTAGAPAGAERVARTLRLIVGEWRWPVVPGVHLTRAGVCSCGDAECAEPGAHPVDTASWLAASSELDRVRDWWLACPLAAVVLPVGWHVDLIDAPECGGREALGRLEMMGYRPAPVISTVSERLLFLVAAGARRPADFAERSRPRSRARLRPGAVLPTQPGPETGLWLGGDCAGAPDIVVRRRGVLVLPPLGPEPPGVTRWLIEPDPVRHPLPRAEDVLGPIVLACRDVANRRLSRTARSGTGRATTVPGVAAGPGVAASGRASAGRPAAAAAGSVAISGNGRSGAVGAADSPDAVTGPGLAAGSRSGSGGPVVGARTPAPGGPGGPGGHGGHGGHGGPGGRGGMPAARRAATAAAGRARAERRRDADGAAWTERLRLIQSEQPRAPS